MKRIVLALGGNALGNSPQEQLDLVRQTAKAIVDLVEEGHEVVIAHGNGPQVGMINLAMTYASENGAGTPEMPFPECGAMSQGYIGYQLQQAIRNELAERKISKSCCSIVSQVVVDREDPAFENPTKPIGAFYSKEEAEKIAEERSQSFVEDSGRGYRRVVASPSPVKIVEIDIIEAVVNSGNVVIAGGGGGVPVIETEKGLEGVPAVIDKDKTSAKLALDLKADVLLILTAVEKVAINFNKPDQEDLGSMTLEDIEKYIGQDQFAKGSMLPKVEACRDFIKQAKDGSVAIISSLVKAKEAIEGNTGTLITK